MHINQAPLSPCSFDKEPYKKILTSLLHGFAYAPSSQTPTLPFDRRLYETCLSIAAERGYTVSPICLNTLNIIPNSQPESESLLPHLAIAVAGVSACAARLNDLDARSDGAKWEQTRVFVVLLLAFTAYVDTIAERDASVLEPLMARVMGVDLHHGRTGPGAHTHTENTKHAVEQKDEAVVLAFADLLKKTYDYFPVLVADYIVQGTLAFHTTAILESRMQSTKVHPAALKYHTFIRSMSSLGLINAHVIFIGYPLEEYVPVIPYVEQVLSSINTVMSFYKEEVSFDTGNFVSTLATARNVSKMVILNEQVKEALDAHKSILEILADKSELCSLYRSYAEGLIAVHLHGDRYRLDELELSLGLGLKTVG